MRWIRENSLSLFFYVIFIATVAAQSIAGHKLFNEDALAHHGEPISYGRYLTSSSFGQAVMENWQSEFLQFSLYIFTTIFLLQRGSTESKEFDKAGVESEQDQLIGQHAKPDSPRWARAGGLRTWLFSNSLIIVMTVIFFGSLFAQSVTGWSTFNADQIDHHQPEDTYVQYLGSSDFWQDALQNWQSEFLAVGTMVVFSIYLRQRGSPESKPVGASHEATGVEG